MTALEKEKKIESIRSVLKCAMEYPQLFKEQLALNIMGGNMDRAMEYLKYDSEALQETIKVVVENLECDLAVLTRKKQK